MPYAHGQAAVGDSRHENNKTENLLLLERGLFGFSNATTSLAVPLQRQPAFVIAATFCLFFLPLSFFFLRGALGCCSLLLL